MARIAKPWFRKLTGWWMVTLGGKQHKLAEGRENKMLAQKKLLELQLQTVQLDRRPVDVPAHFHVLRLVLLELMLQLAGPLQNLLGRKAAEVEL